MADADHSWRVVQRREFSRRFFVDRSRFSRRRTRTRAFGLAGVSRHVTFPIGFRTAMPSVSNTCISVLKGSSLIVAIGFPELTDRAVSIVGQTFRVYEMFFTIAVIYLLVVWAFSMLMRWAERRLAIPGFGI